MAPSRAHVVVLLLVALSSPSRFAAAVAPVEVKWASNPIGPDGPWNVVEIAVGSSSGRQQMPFFPGATFQTFTPTTDLCQKNISIPCFTSYNRDKAEEDSGSTADIGFRAPSQHYARGIRMAGKNAQTWVDTFQLLDGRLTIPNVSMALMDEDFIVYPNGAWYPPAAGCFSVGGNENAINQSFVRPGGPPLNASIIPGFLQAKNEIASNSFTMHIGSSRSALDGSFYFGGYDQNRVAGDVLTIRGAYRDSIALKDIAIQVFQGDSPFNFSGKATGLLAAGNSSITGGLQVKMDGCSPYLALPKSTCDAIAAYLPVTYNSGLGLYTWNTKDARYDRIVKSPSALTFTFADTAGKVITIAVPFQHLSLTLSAPLMPDPTPYFPCSTTRVDDYVLGRAFLQDAFIGSNWKTERWWLAQAPGPNIGRSKKVVEIVGDASPTKGGDVDWQASWEGAWANIVDPPSTNSTGAQSSTGGKAGLSTGGKAGIAVGVVAVALGMIAAAMVFMRRRKVAATQKTAYSPGTTGDMSEASSKPQSQEVEGVSYHFSPPSEVPATPVRIHDSPGYGRHELPAG